MTEVVTFVKDPWSPSVDDLIDEQFERHDRAEPGYASSAGTATFPPWLVVPSGSSLYMPVELLRRVDKFVEAILVGHLT